MADTLDFAQKGFFDLDENNLDKSWFEQAKTTFLLGRMLADALLARETAKQDMKVIYAELDHAIRKRPEDFDMDKVTDKSVEQGILRHKKYIKAQEVYLQRAHQADVVDAALTAWSQDRKKALEKVVDLELAGYRATPREPRQIRSQDSEERSRNSERRVNKSIKARKKDEDE